MHIVYYLWTHKFHFSTNFSLKMGPIYTFKNYFVIVFFSFQFSAVSKRTLSLYDGNVGSVVLLLKKERKKKEEKGLHPFFFFFFDSETHKQFNYLG